MDYGKQLRSFIWDCVLDGVDADEMERVIKQFAQQRYDAGWKDASQHTRKFYSDDRDKFSWDERLHSDTDDLTTPPRVALP